jgi:hypothetical protein
LAELGYTNVRDYEGGKQDWIEAGFPVEGESASSSSKDAGASKAEIVSTNASTNPQKDVA